MSREEKAAVAQEEKVAELAAIDKVKDRIADREYANRGGYHRIMPLDFDTKFLKRLVEEDASAQEAMQREMADLSACADAVYLSAR